MEFNLDKCENTILNDKMMCFNIKRSRRQSKSFESPNRPVDTVSSRVSSSLSSVSSTSSPSSPKVPKRSILAAVCNWIQKGSGRSTSGNCVPECSPSVTACFSKGAFPGCRHYNIGNIQEDDHLYNSTLRSSPKQTLEPEPSEISQFTQTNSQDRELVISEQAIVFHAWYPTNPALLLRIPDTDKMAWLQTQSCSTLPRAPKRDLDAHTKQDYTVRRRTFYAGFLCLQWIPKLGRMR
ncbi:uncharacterized protein [Heterodontus francisci]|uniref:uncharacterized protein n=1 Tax=Heterodontus francisci TaxID=7792 RepID=UPI00355AD7B2